MAGTWIICPNLWGARLFEYNDYNPAEENMAGIKAGITFLREFPRPRVHTKLEDFHDDDETAEIIEPIEDPELERRVAESFMKYVAAEIEKSARRREFDRLILCAEMHLLTILERRLGEESRGRVVATVPQDMYEVNETDLYSYVKDSLVVPTPRGSGAKGRGRRRAA